jgi:hypothetical protein
VLPFAVPDSKRPLNPMMPLGARGAQNGVNGNEAGFNNTNALGQPIAPIINEIVNFGWEYVWHCHILSHEEMDMMRPQSVFVPRALPDAPVLTFTRGSVILHWTDGTPVNYLDPTTWASTKNEIGFRIERARLSGDVNSLPGPYSVIATALANTTTYTDLTTVPGWNYTYRVIAFNASTAESPSNDLVVPALAPADPTGLNAVAVDPYHVNMTWTDNANNELGYDIERCTGVGCTNFARIDGVGANIAAYPDSGLAPNTTYSYRVIAYNMGGNSAPSNIATVTTPAPPAVGPNAPTNLTATLLSGPVRAQLTWRDNSNNENLFQVWRSVNGGAFTQVGTVNRSNTQRTATGGMVTFTNNNLTAGNTYAYYVIAVNTVPNPDQLSAPSNTASVTLPTLPAAPTNLRVTAVTRTSVSLAWNDNSNNETTFEIQYRLGGGVWQTAGIVPANTTVYISTGWPRNYTIFFRVRAQNAGGNSAWSNTVQGVTLP